MVDPGAQRLLLAIFEPRHERVLTRIVAWCWSRDEEGFFGNLGCHLDDLRNHLYLRRCRKAGL